MVPLRVAPALRSASMHTGLALTRSCVGLLGTSWGPRSPSPRYCATDPAYGMAEKGTTKMGQRGGNKTGQQCNVLFGDPKYGLTTDNAVGCLTALMTIMYCGGNWGQALAGVGGGLVGSTAIQYMRTP